MLLKAKKREEDRVQCSVTGVCVCVEGGGSVPLQNDHLRDQLFLLQVRKLLYHLLAQETCPAMLSQTFSLFLLPLILSDYPLNHSPPRLFMFFCPLPPKPSVWGSHLGTLLFNN